MSDTTLLSHFIANLNTNVFLREFSFSQTRFTPTGGTQVELADHVVRIGHLLFLYQLKERDSSATTTIDRWLKKKVVTRATQQIRATIHLLNSDAPVLVANERGHIFNLAARPGDRPFRLVLFKSGDTRTSLPYPRFHRSASAGFIHIFEALYNEMQKISKRRGVYILKREGTDVERFIKTEINLIQERKAEAARSKDAKDLST